MVVRFLTSREIDTLVIGAGSTFVIRDGGVRGAVLNLGHGFKAIEPIPDWTGAPLLKVEAGTELRSLVLWTAKNGLGGLEFLYGIPGTMGGAVVNNAAAWGNSIADCLVSVETMDAQGELHTLVRSEIKFGYSKAALPEGHIVVSATLKGQQKMPEEVEREMDEFQNRRRKVHPLNEHCAGMVFFNPDGHSAGEMVERCGLKGVQVGDAEISRVHGNFIVNLGNANARQIVSLIGMIQERVYVRYKIKLEPKVNIVGAWEKSKMRIQE
jgi:UDP-N-acetylmuramate dehydrogenase